MCSLIRKGVSSLTKAEERNIHFSLVFALPDTDRAGGGHYFKYFATEYLEIVLENKNM